MIAKTALKTIQLMTSKIEINRVTDEGKPSSENNRFYPRYSRFILKALKRNRFQKFLNLMLKLEDIGENNIDSIKIEPYPCHKRTGISLAGKCNPFTGKIRIYPKSRKFCNSFNEKYGKNLLITYAGNRARASLIHELLHLKYTNDESKVRDLTKTYFFKYVKSTYGENLDSLSVCNLIFEHKITYL